MASSIILANLSRMSAVETITFSRMLQTKLTGHPVITEPYPPYVTSLQQLGTNTNLLESADYDARNRDVEKISIRNVHHGTVRGDLKSILGHVELAAKGDVAVLQGLGLKVRSKKRKASAPVLPGKLVLLVTLLKGGGFACEIANGCKGAAAEVQITEGDPRDEGSWGRGETSMTTKFQITGKTPGKEYILRARCIGTAGPGPWSDYVSVIAV